MGRISAGRSMVQFSCKCSCTPRLWDSRKKADRAIELALAEWNQKTPNQKQGWFNERRATQKLINERHLREELDNEVK